MSPFTANLLATIGSVLGCVLGLPQARRVWRFRHQPTELEGISPATQVMTLASACIWGAYAVGTGALLVGASGLVTAPTALMTLAVLHRAGHLLPPRRPVMAPDGCSSRLLQAAAPAAEATSSAAPACPVAADAPTVPLLLVPVSLA